MRKDSNLLLAKINSIKMKTNIQIFTSEIFGNIRTCQVNNQIMFVGKDVATALGYKNPSNALQVHVDPEDKTTYPIQVSGSNYKTNALFVNESGLYALILSSKLPQAKAFKRWVTAEVLPQIRKTGGYIPTKDAQGRQLSNEEIIDLVRLRTHVSYSLKGQKKVKVYMTWTLDGLRFLNSKLGYPNF